MRIWTKLRALWVGGQNWSARKRFNEQPPFLVGEVKFAWLAATQAGHLELSYNLTSKRRPQAWSWLKGINPPLVTSFDERSKIVPLAPKAEVDFQISSGVKVVRVGGSIGEGAGFTTNETFQ